MKTVPTRVTPLAHGQSPVEWLTGLFGEPFMDSAWGTPVSTTNAKFYWLSDPQNRGPRRAIGISDDYTPRPLAGHAFLADHHLRLRWWVVYPGFDLPGHLLRGERKIKFGSYKLMVNTAIDKDGHVTFTVIDKGRPTLVCRYDSTPDLWGLIAARLVGKGADYAVIDCYLGLTERTCGPHS
jgi:hypothetical protein